MSACAVRSFVYFVRCGEYVKVGFSYDPKARLRSLRSQIKRGSGHMPTDIDPATPLEIVHLIPGCRMRDERIIHGLLAQHHVAGEWFRYDLAFIHHMRTMRYLTCLERSVLIHLAKAKLKRRALADRSVA